MTSDRTYRKALPEKVAEEELHEGSGTQFDPQVVAALLRYLDRVNRARKAAEETQIFTRVPVAAR